MSVTGTGCGRMQQRGKTHVFLGPPLCSNRLLMEEFQAQGGVDGGALGGGADALGAW